MNERIDVLALQATDSKGGLDRHKFAELIVLGCIDIANKNRTAMEMDRNTHLAADALKQHFGVKE